MRVLLRSIWTNLWHGLPGCAVCGRPPHCPGALWADVCEGHYLERLDALTR